MGVWHCSRVTLPLSRSLFLLGQSLTFLLGLISFLEPPNSGPSTWKTLGWAQILVDSSFNALSLASYRIGGGTIMEMEQCTLMPSLPGGVYFVLSFYCKLECTCVWRAFSSCQCFLNWVLFKTVVVPQTSGSPLCFWYPSPDRAQSCPTWSSYDL